jgi:N-acetylmuramoyl-L-alanine amidase
MKKRLSTTHIVIHNLATSPSMNWGWRDVDREHRSRGWLAGGYHFVICRDGTIDVGRPLDTWGAHCPAVNGKSVAIAMSGGIAQDASGKPLPKVPQDNFTPAQHNALRMLVPLLQRIFPVAVVAGHGELQPDKPHCPGFDFRKVLGTT